MATSANRSPSGEHQLIPQSDDVDYVTLTSNEFFYAIGQDNNVLTDEKMLFNKLRQRKNKKEDFIVALSNLDRIMLRNSSIPTWARLRCSLDMAPHYNSDDFLLLTELAYRIYMLNLPTNNELNNNRCIELAEQIERASSRAWIKGVVMAVLFPVIIAGIFYASYSLMLYLQAKFIIPFLTPTNATYLSMGISSIIGLFSSNYAINRLRSSNGLNDVFLATQEFFFSKSNAVPDEGEAMRLSQPQPEYKQLESIKLFPSIDRTAPTAREDGNWLFDLLNSRKNKKLDLLAALSYLEDRYADRNANGYAFVQDAVTWMRAIVHRGSLNSQELVLLTELAYRMTKIDSDNNHGRCLVIIERLENARSWSEKSIAKVFKALLVVSCVIAGILLPTFLAIYTSSIPLVAFSVFTLLNWGVTYLEGSKDCFSESRALERISASAKTFFFAPPQSAETEEKSSANTANTATNAAARSPEEVPLVSVSVQI